MKEIFESWNRYLTLRESKVEINNMDPSYIFDLRKNGRAIELELMRKGEDGEFVSVPSNSDKKSIIRAEPSQAKCLRAMEIKWANAPGGYGPMMYDIMMELSGEHGIYADRTGISGQAEHVWGIYEFERDDVESFDPRLIVDDSYGNEECIDMVEDMFPDADHEPTSMVFRRIDGKMPTVDALKQAGKLL